MVVRPEFHLLKYGSSRVVYHPDSAMLLDVSADDAMLVRQDELARDPLEALGRTPIGIDAVGDGDAEYEDLCVRLRRQADIDPTRVTRYLSTGLPANGQTGLGKTAELTKLVLLVSHGCNMGCAYCFQSKVNEEHLYITPELACRAVEAFLSRYPGRLRIVFFFGGEPLLNWPTILSTVRFTLDYCQAHRIDPPRFAVQTNGTLLDAAKADYLKQHNFLVTVSLDGPPVVNDAQRLFGNGMGAYDRARRGIDWLVSRGVRFTAEATITRLHLKLGVSVKEVRDHLVGLGAHSAHIMPITGPFPELQLTPEIVQHAVAQFAGVAADSVSSLVDGSPRRLQYALCVLENLIRGPHREVCYAGTGTATVRADGTVYPCYYLASPDYLMGRVGEGEPLGQQYDRVQSQMASHVKANTWPCRVCWGRHLCNACYGASPTIPDRLSAPAAEVCLIQRGMIDAVLGALAELGRVPEKWSALLESLAVELQDGG